MTNLRDEFLNILKSDKSESDKYTLFLELLPRTKKCAKCKEYLMKSEFKQGYCVPCKNAYSRSFRAKRSKEATRHCGMCDKTKDASEFYGTCLYRCKECTKRKQGDYSMKYYYTKGRDRRRKMTQFYNEHNDDSKRT